MRAKFKKGTVLFTKMGSMIKIKEVLPTQAWEYAGKKGVGVYEVERSHGLPGILSFEYLHTAEHILPPNKYQKVLFASTGYEDE